MKEKKSFLLICPACRKKLINNDEEYACTNESCLHAKDQHPYKTYKEIPILISDKLCDTVCDPSNIETKVKRTDSKLDKFKHFLSGTNSKTKNNCHLFVQKINKKSKNPKVLVIGSGEQGSGTSSIWSQNSIQIDGVDIYISDTVDIVCDAHYLPFEDESYDGVWIQAVLEHVVEPIKVVSEIYRVLKLGGIVYAETPFMQQVHEGAYDFTRYTVLGHRYLFKRFKMIDIGGHQGPEIVLSWSFRHFFWSLFRNKKIGQIIGFFCGFILRPFKYLIHDDFMYDASAGVYFFGEKKNNHELSHKELIKLYRGRI